MFSYNMMAKSSLRNWLSQVMGVIAMETTNNCFTVSVPDIVFALWPIQPYACIGFCTPFPPELVQAKPAHFSHLYRYRQNLHTFPTCTGTGKTCTLFPPVHVQENPARFSHLNMYRQNLHVCLCSNFSNSKKKQQKKLKKLWLPGLHWKYCMTNTACKNPGIQCINHLLLYL